MDLTFVLDPIAPAVADRLRETGGPVYVADEKPGYPCRQCLRDAEVGESLVLVAHDPFDHDSPYRSRSLIFLHVEPCGSPDVVTEIPLQIRIRQLSVRAFDAEAIMIEAAVVDGGDLEDTVRAMLGLPTCEEVHVQNAGRGVLGGKGSPPLPTHRRIRGN